MAIAVIVDPELSIPNSSAAIDAVADFAGDASMRELVADLHDLLFVGGEKQHFHTLHLKERRTRAAPLQFRAALEIAQGILREGFYGEGAE